MQLNENSSLDRYQWAAKKIAEISNRLTPQKITIFDVGARDSILTKYIDDTNITYCGFDMDPMNEIVKKWNIEKSFSYEIASPQIIAMLEIIEHLKNPWLCIENVSKVIAPGGYLILTTPNPAWSNARIDLLRTGYLTCFFKSDLELNHHVFTPWPHIVERILNDSGFEIVEYATLDGKTVFFDENMRGINIPIKFFFRAAKKVIERLDKTACGMSYGIIARKSE